MDKFVTRKSIKKRGRVSNENSSNRDAADELENHDPTRNSKPKRSKTEEMGEEEPVVLMGEQEDSGLPNSKKNGQSQKQKAADTDDRETTGKVAESSAKTTTTNPRRSMRFRKGDIEEAERTVELDDQSSRKGILTRKSKVEAEEKALLKAAETSLNPPLECCHQPAKLRFHVPNNYCSHPDSGCRLVPGQTYFLYDYGGQRKKYCREHYEVFNMPVDQKERFFRIKINENRHFEEVLTCSKCSDKFHRICGLHLDKDKTTCLCLGCGKGPRVFKPRRAPQNEPKSTAFMMKKINGFLKGTSITIKTFTSSGTSKIENVVPKHLQKDFKGPLEFKKRAMYFYQKRDSVDVVFFAMYCREYSNTGIYNNQNGGGWFVVDYLDSVPYFEGAQKRELYPKILLTYFEYMRSMGILNGFLHADPPVQGDDYVFNIHPQKQTYKTEKDLIKWYRKIFGIGKKEGLVKTFRTFREESALREFTSPTDIPLFEGALWSKIVKEAAPKDFENVMIAKYKYHATDNFFLELEEPKNVEKDDEAVNENPIMMDRLKFLDFCQRKNWEFGDLRHAKFSSLAITQWLEEQQ